VRRGYWFTELLEMRSEIEAIHKTRPERMERRRRTERSTTDTGRR
jgi:hypothetical protein